MEKKLGEHEIQYWGDLWNKGEKFWHRNVVHAKLKQHLQKLTEGSQDRVFFFPLCGKTLDMVHLWREGFKVVGNEGVEQACEEFFAENAIEFTTEKLNGCQGKLFKSLDAKLLMYCCNFFELTPEVLNDLRPDCVFDRGSLGAIDHSVHEEYSKVMKRILSDRARYLLACVEYEKGAKKGPPFAIDLRHAKNLFGDEFEVEVLDDRVPDNSGITKENLFLLTKSAK